MSKILVRVRLTGRDKLYWQAYWRDESGKQHHRGLGRARGQTRTQAEQKARRLEDHINSCAAAAEGTDAPRVGDWATVVADRRGRKCSATLELYHTTRNYLVEFFGELREIDSVKPEDAMAFADWLRKRVVRGKPITEQTVHNHCRRAHTVWQEAIGLEKIGPRNPWRVTERSAIPVDPVWYHVDEEAAEKLMKAARHRSLRLLIALCRFAGLRRGEALRLRWQDVDFEKRVLTVEHVGEHSTKKRRRLVPICPRLHDILVDALETGMEGDILVASRRNPYNLVRYLHIAAKAAGLKSWDDAWNVLRRSCLTDWCRRLPPMDVAKIAGNSVAVIERHYHQVTQHVMDAVAAPKAPSAERVELGQILENLQPEQIAALLAAARNLNVQHEA